MKLSLNIYDKKGKNIERVAEGETVEIMLGVIESLVDILDLDNAKNDIDILKRVVKAYKELKNILSNVFTDVTADEWDRVKVKELVPQLLAIVKYTFTEIGTIPTEKN